MGLQPDSIRRAASSIKIFLTARVEERAKRRYNELLEKGTQVSYEEVLLDMQKRDLNDSTRAFAPLKQADDAVLIDTTKYDFDESVNKILSYIKENMK